MTNADKEKKIFSDLSASIVKWTDLFFSDKACVAFDLRTKFLEEDMIELRRIRWFSMHMESELEKLWLRYVDRPAVEDEEVRQSFHDFVMNGCVYILVNNPCTEQDFNDFVKHLSKSISWPQRASLVPESLREYFGTEEEFVKVLSSNTWLIFLILLSMTDIK